ncbi:MAG: hypothetical protein JEZ03_15575, partial [Bacteroidales bacterium]|nr:hypothetical protein [Bacteroidales bacterium]
MDLNHKTELDQLISLFADVINYLKGKEINRYEGLKFAEGLAKKTFFHICSIYSLANGYRVLLDEKTYIDQIDHSSMSVMLRAALESYLTFNHIFIAPKEEDEIIFRFNCWDYAGFIERRDLYPATIEHKQLQKSEAILAERVWEKIERNNYFQRLSKDAKKKIKRGEWKHYLKWKDLAVDAKFDEIMFIDMYKYLCSYSHSGRLSVLQLLVVKDDKGIEQMLTPVYVY